MPVPGAVADGRRDQILREAARLFAERGFARVAIDDIGAAVGVSGPALYRHFAGKDALLAELLVGISEHLLQGGRAQLAAAAGPAEALERLVAWHVDFALEHPALITVHDRDLPSLGDEDGRRVRRLQRAYVEVWVGVLRELDRTLDLPRARAAAHAGFGLLNSTPHSAVGLDRSAMAALLTRMGLAALRG